MKAAVMESVGSPLVIRDVDVATPIGREVLVQVKASGLCHSDLMIIENGFGLPMPAILGHEVAGIVTEIGPLVTEFAVGDHVVGCMAGFCGICEQCAAGRPYRCRNQRINARAGGEPPRLSMNGEPVTQGFELSGFAEQVLVHENSIVKVSKEIAFDKACLLGCGVVTGAGAVINSAQVRVGQTVAVLGCGGVGLSAIQGARLAGARRIIAIDVQPGKLELARRFGATDVLNPADGDVVEAVKALVPGGVDHAFEVAGLTQTLMQAFNMLATGGTAYIVGLQKPGTVLDLPVAGMLLTQQAIRAVFVGSTNFKVDIPMFVDFYLQGRFNLDDLVSKTISLNEINEGYAELSGGAIARSVIVF